jgi:sigma-B regulation protein RsbU (phosphoserine phosphatase)
LPFQQYGLKGNQRAAFLALRLNETDALVRELMKGQPFVDLQDLDEAPEMVLAWNRDSTLALPLATKGELFGTMIVELGGSDQRFLRRGLSILSGIAGQAAMAIENDLLLQEAAEQERMKQELAVAHRIQASFVPDCCPAVSGWDLAPIWRSARQVGGDFYDFVPLPASGENQRLDGSRMGLVIADVADKGVPAALFMALSRTLVRTMAIDGRPPAAAIARANDLMLADASSGLFVTLFYAIIRPEEGEVTYVNAGHMPPLVVRAADGAVEELRVPGMALGVLPSTQFQEWKDRKALLEPGDVLILYTDGVTDASGSEEQRFGLERLRQVVSTHRHLSAAELADTIHEAVENFVGGAPQIDDFTLLVAKRNT